MRSLVHGVSASTIFVDLSGASLKDLSNAEHHDLIWPGLGGVLVVGLVVGVVELADRS